MRLGASWVAIFVCAVLGDTRPAVAQVDQQRAQEYFKEVQALCQRDGGRLWGRVGLRTDGDRDIRTLTFAARPNSGVSNNGRNVSLNCVGALSTARYS